MEYDILVNKEHLLNKDYVPENLVITDNNENNFHHYKDPTLKPMVVDIVYKAFLELQKEALKNGYVIIIDSGYRSSYYQEVIWNNIVKEKGIEYAQKYVMPPTSSEHQTGLAFDIAYLYNDTFIDDVKSTDKEFLWLKENAYKFGFILRYPLDKEYIAGINFEPWHFRYVGVELSTYLYQENMCLEEYHLLKRKKL